MLGAVLAAGPAAGLPARTKGLYVDGLDVLLAPALFPGAGNRMGVPIESVKVQELGPGGVSSMTFVVEDPTASAFAAVEGSEVRLEDLANGYTIFRGWIQSWDVEPSHGEQGRTWTITCIGPEALLDWGAVTTTSLSWAIDDMRNTFDYIVARILAASTGYGPLRAAAVDDDTTQVSSAAFPVMNLANGITAGYSSALTIQIGTTIREAIRQAFAALNAMRQGSRSVFAYSGPIDLVVTVDMQLNLRVWYPKDPSLGTVQAPSDYSALVATNTPGSSTNTEGLKYSVDASSIPRGVIVTGTGVTVVTMDGSGRPGPVQIITDPTITTVVAATSAGRAYLAGRRAGIRGSYRWTDRAPTIGAHTGSKLTLTDNRVIGLVPLDTPVFGIDRTFTGAREDWTITFGGLPRSAARILRRWTRGNRD